MKNKLKKLNLGCGHDYKTDNETEEWINLDISPDVNADVITDFIKAMPWRALDDTFDEILANNSLTQILNGDDFIKVMNEMHRITKSSGIIKIRVPNAMHPCAFQDPMDCRRFTDQSFTYMDVGHRRYQEYGSHYGFKPFAVKLVDNNGIQMHFELTPIK